MVREKAMPVMAGCKTVFKSKDLACKVLLVLGNAPGYPAVGLAHLSIQNEYLSNTTIQVQHPLNQRIITTFKIKYK